MSCFSSRGLRRWPMTEADRPQQSACTRAVVDAASEGAVVSNLGAASFILGDVADRDLNFYMRGGMGVTTPVGLGLALSIDRPVTVLDGDGSLLMSLGCLATVANCDPANLTVVVFDNESYATTGGQPTFAVDFAAVATDLGLAAHRTNDLSGFEAAFEAALSHDGASLVHAEVVTDRPSTKPDIDYAHSFLKHRFRSAVAGD